jgi:hypothetical protein
MRTTRPHSTLGFWKFMGRQRDKPEASQVVKTLRYVFVGGSFGTFQLHRQDVFDQEIGKVLPNRVSGLCSLHC